MPIDTKVAALPSFERNEFPILRVLAASVDPEALGDPVVVLFLRKEKAGGFIGVPLSGSPHIGVPQTGYSDPNSNAWLPCTITLSSSN